MLFRINALLLVLALAGSQLAASLEPEEDGKRVDEQIEEALDFYKFTVMMDSFRSLDEELHKAGVNLEAVAGPIESSRSEFVTVLLNHILKGKSNSEIKEWANRETPNDYYIGGKKEFEMIINAGVVRECETVQPLMWPHLNQLSSRAELRSQVSKETLVYWEIMRACDIITEGVREGKLIEDLYAELQKRYKNNNPDFIRTLLANLLRPFQPAGNSQTKKKEE